jgi:CRISPR/Cas system-associated exonuclease Cas4 (RecB family)
LILPGPFEHCMNIMGSPLVLSMSAISTFLRCKKKYEIQYEKLLDGIKENEAMAEGTAFHSIMARYARGEGVGDKSPMGVVAKIYLEHKAFPSDIVLVEEPIYIQFLEGVYIRGTCDLIYKDEDGTLVIRDWKTFARLPSLDADLDFQARLYIALVMHKYKTSNVRFEHVYVRKTPPGIPKDKAGNCWTPEECYITPPPILMSLHEVMTLVQEVKWELENVLYTRKHGRYSRSPQKGGGWQDCSFCSVKEICKAELTLGELTESALYGISRKREPVEIPEFLQKNS